MAVCPTCNHTNPEGAIQCEACFTPLPTLIPCPHCGSSVQSDATFCGNCGQTIDPQQLAITAPDEEESPTPIAVAPENSEPIPAIPEVSSTPAPFPVGTQLQPQGASLVHVQTQTTLEIPVGMAVIHVGKPNDKVPPDIDVSGFANSDVVSRVHADIRLEGNEYFLEDVGSANGTYVNHTALPPGNRHLLRPGDRFSLGKGDLVTFIFQLN
ncbi:FHA domain-containing protein [Synechocystis salina LEGE 06155]|nr:FHA domain-containing protein [Synechocystis salina LEGE 06155]